jgi:hypothetical protein
MSKSAAAKIEDDIRQKWQTRTLRARGLWLTIRECIDQGDGKRVGFLLKDGRPMRTEEIADMANTSVTTVEGLIRKLDAAGLVSTAGDGAIYSKYLVRLHEVRAMNVERVRRFNAKTKDGALVNAPNSINRVPTNAQPPPSLSLSPTPPLSIPPTPKPFPTGMAVAGEAADAKPGRKRAKAPVFPPGVWDRAVAGWKNAYRHVHGVDPTLTSRGLRGLSDMLTAVESNLDALADVVRAGLREPERGIWQGHKLNVLAENFDYLRGKIVKGTVGHGNTVKPSAAERGEYPEPCVGRLKILNAGGSRAGVA